MTNGHILQLSITGNNKRPGRCVRSRGVDGGGLTTKVISGAETARPQKWMGKLH